MGQDPMGLEFELAPIAIERYAANGELEWANAAAMAAFGMGPDLPAYNMFESPRVEEELKSALKRGERTCQTFAFDPESANLETSAQGTTWYRVTAFPTQPQGRDEPSYWLIYEDFSSRRYTETELDPTEIKNMLHSASQGWLVAALSIELKILYSNQLWAEAHGGDRRTILGRGWLEAAPTMAESELHKRVKRVMKRGYPETCLWGAKGRAFEFDIRPTSYGVILAGKDVTDWLDAQEELRRLPAHLQQAREAEARRLAGEIHDDLGAALTAIGMETRLAAGGDPANRDSHLEQARAIAKEALGTVRRLAQELRPPLLDHAGLVPALREMCSAFAGRREGACRVEAPETLEVAGPLAVAAYRIVQESLTNIERHAGTEAGVAVRLIQDDGNLKVAVEDYGIGFEIGSDTATASLGLASMRERARAAGGTLTIESHPGQGTTVTALLPLETHP